MQRDEEQCFQMLLDYQDRITDISVQQLSQCLTKFRKTLSFYWVKQHEKESKRHISLVIQTVIKYSEHPNTGIRLSTYSVLGQLLLSVAPFAPLHFIFAFSNALSYINTSPKKSIAIINMFMSLTRFVTPVRIQDFVDKMPIAQHFSFDMSEFIKFIPQIIPMMQKLPLIFHQNLLESLFHACEQCNTPAFASTIYLLICLNKKPLIEKLKEIIQSGSHQNVVVYLGPHLMSDKELIELLGEDGQEIILESSYPEFNRNPLSLSEFECAAKIVGSMVRYTKGTPRQKEIIDKFNQHILDDYSTVYQNALLFVPTPIEKIVDVPTDPDSFRIPKLTAMVNFFLDNQDTADPDEFAERIYHYSTTKNDLYCAMIDNFSRVINIFLRTCKGTKHIELLDIILNKEKQNFVQEETVALFIEQVDTNLCQKKYPSYKSLVIKNLIEFTISKNDRLYNTSINVLIHFVSCDTIDQVLEKILYSDWFNENITSRRFYLLSKLATIFEPYRFVRFIGIAYDCLSFCARLMTISHIYAFLSKAQVTEVPESILSFSYNFVAVHYQNYTHCMIEDTDQPVLSTEDLDYDTDIVSNPHLDHRKALNHLRHCYMFLCSVPIEIVDQEKLFKFSIALVPIFDIIALQQSAKLAVTQKQIDFVHRISLIIFKSTSDDEVAAACCKIFVNDTRALPEKVESMLEQFLDVKKTVNPDLLFMCFVAIDQNSHEKTVSSVGNVLNRLTDQQAIVLLFKLILILGKDIINNIKDNFGLALIQYANEFGKKYEQTVRKYISTHPFSAWPLYEPLLTENLITFLSKRKIVIEVENIDEMDEMHWEFVVDHPEFFLINAKLIEYIDTHEFKTDFSRLLSKTGTFSVQHVQDTNYVSCSPLLSLGVVLQSIPLITSHFRFNNKKLHPELFEKVMRFVIIKKEIETLKLMLNYAYRKRMKINVLDDPIFMHKEILPLAIKLDSRLIDRINIPLDPSMILKAYKDPLIREIVRARPSYFFQYLISQEAFKAHDFIPILPIMLDIDFSIDQITTIIMRVITQFSSYESDKKRCVFLRFLTLSLISIRQKLPKEFKGLSNLVSFQFPMFASNDFPTLLQELSLLLHILAPANEDATFFSDFLQESISIQSIPSMILRIGIEFMKSKSISLPSLSSQFFQGNLEICQPSRTALTLISLKYFCDGDDFNNFVYPIFDHLEARFTEIMNNFRTAEAFSEFLVQCLMSGNFDKIGSAFFNNFIHASLNNFDHPSSEFYLPLVAKLIPHIPHIGLNLFEAPSYSTILLASLWECYQYLLGKQKTSVMEFQQQTLEKLIPFYLKYPKLDVITLIVEIARYTPDFISLLFIELPVKVSYFLPLFSVLRTLFHHTDHIYQNKIKEALTMSAEIIHPASRFFAMMMFSDECDDQQKCLAFYIAASETDSFNSIVINFDEQIKIASIQK